jgi:parallel beta-helix repeat protein
MRGVVIKASVALLVFSTWSYQSALSLDVSGDVWGVWSPDNNPYRVVGELRVPPGSSLVIQPGCFIDFQGHYKFMVDSTAILSAVGTESDSITFTTADTATGWFGLRFYYADSNSELSYCIIEYGKAAFVDEPWPPWPDMEGGGVNCVNSDISITHCFISNNVARDGRGGGIFIWESTALISDNTIHQNRAGFYGGGIHCSGCDVTISGNSITANIAWFPLGGDMGGGISCFDSDVNIIDNIIKYNTAGVSSGGIKIFGGSLAFIVNNIIEHNIAELCGGIGLRGPDTYIANNVIANNLAGHYNGGIVLNSPRITLLNNVVAFNEAQLQPGVSLIGEGIDSVLNNIIWGNISPGGEQIFIDCDSAVVAFCDIEGGWEGEGNIDVDPLFRNPENGNFHLMSTDCGYPYDSPCIDAGYPGMIDIILDCSWGLGTTVCDMGAYGGGDSSMVAVEYDHSKTPERLSLMQNYPNPFNAATAIRYNLYECGHVSLSIYNLLGQRVATVFEGAQEAGEHTITWDARDFPSGVYFARLEAGEHSENIKMVLLK